MPLAPRPIITRSPGTSIHNTIAPVINHGSIQGLNNLQPYNPSKGLPVPGRQNPTIPYVGNTPTNGGVISTIRPQNTVISSVIGGLFR